MSYKKIHQEAFVLDSHCDTPMMLLEGVNLGKRLRRGHVDIPRLIEGGVDALFFAIYTCPTLEPDAATRRALEMIARTYDTIEANSDKLALAVDREEALLNRERGVISIFLGMENGAPFQKDLGLLRLFWDMGIRYITLSHNENNEICDSSGTTVKRWGGVSKFGIKVIKEMERLSILTDVSHISDLAFWDVIKYSTRPVIASHSNCRALANHPRNLTDDMIKAIAKTGGVVQVNFYPPFLESSYSEKYHSISKKFSDDRVAAAKEISKIAPPSYKVAVDHIDHIVDLVGVNHVGIGSDFDGIDVTPEGMKGIHQMPLITKELKERGYSTSEIEKILGENLLKLL
ncbi:MAG: dipeptidase [Bacteroidales bacterium]